MKNIVFAASLLILCSCIRQKPESAGKLNLSDTFSTEGKKVTVYTTAGSTDYRLTITGTLQFEELKQPVESKVYVFVDPEASKYVWGTGYLNLVIILYCDIFPEKTSYSYNSY